MASLLSVNVGLPRDVTWNGKTVRTSVWKSSVDGRRMVGKLNIQGDAQADLAGHGGEHRAVFVYQIDSYRYWQKQLSRSDFVYGQFGENFTIDGLVRALIGTALFAGAYQAEVIRGGLQAIPRGQGEAASALGLSWSKTTALIVLPQALRHVIPGLVNSFIGLFKDTTLVLIVGLFDLLGQLRAAFSDPNWATPTTLFTGFAFAGMIYFAFCFGMSRYSLFVERRLNAHRRN